MSEQKNGWKVALNMIERMHDELEAEHNALPGNWLGRPRLRHHQIMAASRVLAVLHRRLATAMVRDAVPGLVTPPEAPAFDRYGTNRSGY